MGAPLQPSVTERHRLGRAGRAGRSGVRGPSRARRPPPARRLRCSRDAVTGASLGRPQTYFLNDAASQHPSETLPGRTPPSPARGEEARVADAGRGPGCTRRPWPPRCGRCGRGAAACPRVVDAPSAIRSVRFSLCPLVGNVLLTSRPARSSCVPAPVAPATQPLVRDVFPRSSRTELVGASLVHTDTRAAHPDSQQCATT